MDFGSAHRRLWNLGISWWIDWGCGPGRDRLRNGGYRNPDRRLPLRSLRVGAVRVVRAHLATPHADRAQRKPVRLVRADWSRTALDWRRPQPILESQGGRWGSQWNGEGPEQP